MTKKPNECIVKVGERNYRIVENTDIGKGVKVYSIDGTPLRLPNSTKVSWWDRDGIVNLIESNMSQIEEILGPSN